MALLIILIQSNFTLFHVGLLGTLSLIASYGLNQKERWALFLTILVSLLGIIFGCVTTYVIYRLFILGWIETIVLLATVSYVILLVASLFYVIWKRDKFK